MDDQPAAMKEIRTAFARLDEGVPCIEAETGRMTFKASTNAMKRQITFTANGRPVKFVCTLVGTSIEVTIKKWEVPEPYCTFTDSATAIDHCSFAWPGSDSVLVVTGERQTRLATSWDKTHSLRKAVLEEIQHCEGDDADVFKNRQKSLIASKEDRKRFEDYVDSIGTSRKVLGLLLAEARAINADGPRVALHAD